MEYLNTDHKYIDNSSSDYSDAEFDNLDYENIDFEKPSKNKDNIYCANLEEKIVLELDNLDIFEILEDNNKKYVIFNLDLDNEDQDELIEILYNLDEIAIDKCLHYSKEWFNKELSEDDIEGLYVPLYLDNYKKKNHILMKVELNKDLDISKLKHENTYIIEIKGLVFYKKTFLYNVYLSNILEEDINLIADISNQFTNKKINVEKTTTDTIDDSEINVEKTSTDTIDDLEINSTVDTIDESEPNSTTDTVDESEPNSTTDTVEYKELLEKKRLEVKENFLNSEKINKEADDLRIKAIESANELKNIELKIK